MTKFFEVNKDVLPIKSNLAIQTARHVKASKRLLEAEEQSIKNEAELEAARIILNEAEEKQAVVVEEATKISDKMNAATSLIEGLADEKVRWTEAIDSFKTEIELLVGDALYLSAFLSYAGPFNQEFRIVCQKVWFDEIERRKIPISEKMIESSEIIERLSDMATVGEWNTQGLPNDRLSTQNGIIITKALRYPLLIDPQTQGKNWIKNLEAENQLVVTTLNDKSFRTQIEDAVSFGTSILIEDIEEELDPILDNVMERNLIKVGTMYKLRFGDKEVDYVESFRLYITTKLPNPTFTPEVNKIKVIIKKLLFNFKIIIILGVCKSVDY